MPFIIKVSKDFAVGAVFDTFEKAQEAAEKLPLKSYEIEEQFATPQKDALKKMVEKLDKRNKRTSRGYVARTPEVIDILSRLSRLTPALIVEREQNGFSRIHKEIDVEITIGFTLERDLL